MVGYGSNSYNSQVKGYFGHLKPSSLVQWGSQAIKVIRHSKDARFISNVSTIRQIQAHKTNEPNGLLCHAVC